MLSLYLMSFQLLHQFIIYGDKCWTSVQTQSNKDELTKKWQHDSLSANFAGMVDDKWPQRSNKLKLYAEDVFAKDNTTFIRKPSNSLIVALQEKPFNNINQSLKKERQTAKFPEKLYMKCKDFYCPCDACCACCCCPLLFMLRAASSSRILCVCSCVKFYERWWSAIFKSEVNIKYMFTDKSSRGMETGVPVCPSVMCTCSEFSVGRVLGRTGWTVGRAGVRWRAGLLLVLRGAIRLQRCHGRWWVFAFGRATLTAE